MIYLAEVPGDLSRQARGKALHRAAWALLRMALEEHAPGLALEEHLAFGPHGKPYLAGGPYFSLSHTDGLALCAVEEWEVGVDVEYTRHFSPRLGNRVFTPSEREHAERAADPDAAFTTLWTLKESYMKFTGKGLGLGPLTVRFSSLGEHPVLEGGGAFFSCADWKGWHIAECGPRPFEPELRPVAYEALHITPDS